MPIYDYDIINLKQFNRKQTHYNHYYESIELFTDYQANAYNIGYKYDEHGGISTVNIILYKDKIEGSIPLRKCYTNGYRIKFSEYLDKVIHSKHCPKYDFNLNIKEIDKKDNPECIILEVECIFGNI